MTLTIVSIEAADNLLDGPSRGLPRTTLTIELDAVKFGQVAPALLLDRYDSIQGNGNDREHVTG